MKINGRFYRAAKLIGYASFFGALLIFAVFPKNQYEWMTDMDAVVTNLPEDDSFGSRLIFLSLVLIAAILSQIFFLTQSAKKSDKLIATFFIAATLIVWFVKYYF